MIRVAMVVIIKAMVVTNNAPVLILTLKLHSYTKKNYQQLKTMSMTIIL